MLTTRVHKLLPLNHARSMSITVRLNLFSKQDWRVSHQPCHALDQLQHRHFVVVARVLGTLASPALSVVTGFVVIRFTNQYQALTFTIYIIQCQFLLYKIEIYKRAISSKITALKSEQKNRINAVSFHATFMTMRPV